MNNKILFIMPVLRTSDYTKLAYESFVRNSGNHDIKICLDLDSEEDKEFYIKEGIPFEVFHGWGHWLMTCYYVKQILDGKLNYQYIGLIHNDMVFGYNWLASFDKYRPLTKPDINLYCFNQENPEHSSLWGRTIETFDYEGYQAYTKENYSEESTNFFAFLPWVMSIDAFISTFKWLVEGDAGIWVRKDFPTVQFLTKVWHFMNIAVSKHRNDYLNNQTTRNNWNSLIHDSRYQNLITYLYNNTGWSVDNNMKEIFGLIRNITGN